MKFKTLSSSWWNSFYFFVIDFHGKHEYVVLTFHQRNKTRAILQHCPWMLFYSACDLLQILSLVYSKQFTSPFFSPQHFSSQSLSQVLCSLIEAVKSATNLNIKHNNGNFLHQRGIQYFHIL